MTKTLSCLVAVCAVAIAGCGGAAARQPIAIVLQPEKGKPVELHIPRGFIEEPKKPEGVLPHVILRIDAKDLGDAAAFAPESELRLLIEPTASAADAAHEKQAAAQRRPKPAEDAIVKSAELSKPGLTAYSYPNGREQAEAYYFTSPSGDVFVECWKSVCKAFKTWDKRVHLRFDYHPVSPADVKAVDDAIDRLLQSFAAQTKL